MNSLKYYLVLPFFILPAAFTFSADTKDQSTQTDTQTDDGEVPAASGDDQESLRLHYYSTLQQLTNSLEQQRELAQRLQVEQNEYQQLSADYQRLAADYQQLSTHHQQLAADYQLLLSNTEEQIKQLEHLTQEKEASRNTHEALEEELKRSRALSEKLEKNLNSAVQHQKQAEEDQQQLRMFLDVTDYNIQARNEKAEIAEHIASKKEENAKNWAGKVLDVLKLDKKHGFSQQHVQFFQELIMSSPCTNVITPFSLPALEWQGGTSVLSTLARPDQANANHQEQSTQTEDGHFPYFDPEPESEEFGDLSNEYICLLWFAIGLALTLLAIF